MLTAERLRELLHYDPETGEFTWRVARGGYAQVGSRAGSVDSHGYRQIKVDRVLYLEHRLAWLYAHGRWPADQLDHKNGVRDANRLGNLRQATRAENNQNVGLRKHNTSGYPGVSQDKLSVKWRAQIQIEGRLKYLGIFATAEEAAAAYRIAKAKYHTFNPETRSAS